MRNGRCWARAWRGAPKPAFFPSLGLAYAVHRAREHTDTHLQDKRAQVRQQSAHTGCGFPGGSGLEQELTSPPPQRDALWEHGSLGSPIPCFISK